MKRVAFVGLGAMGQPMTRARLKAAFAERGTDIGAAALDVLAQAAVRRGWDRWIGADGGFVGMSGFGASGPEGDLFRHFGITARTVATAARVRP